MIKIEAAMRLVADQALAPAESFRSENEENLKGRQHERESIDNKNDGESSKSETNADAEDTAPIENFNATEVRDNPVRKAATSLDPSDLPPSSATSANLRLLADRLMNEEDPLTCQEENANDTSDGIVPNSETGFEQEVVPGDPDPLNVQGSDETLADADPRIFNLAQQPLG
jgi:hypothetical protein